MNFTTEELARNLLAKVLAAPTQNAMYDAIDDLTDTLLQQAAEYGVLPSVKSPPYIVEFDDDYNITRLEVVQPSVAEESVVPTFGFTQAKASDLAQDEERTKRILEKFEEMNGYPAKIVASGPIEDFLDDEWIDGMMRQVEERYGPDPRVSIEDATISELQGGAKLIDIAHFYSDPRNIEEMRRQVEARRVRDDAEESVINGELK